MDNLMQAYDDLNVVWKFYKKYQPATPKDDYFFSQMAAEAKRLKLKTKFGEKVLRTAISAIAEEDYAEKMKSYVQMEIGGKE